MDSFSAIISPSSWTEVLPVGALFPSPAPLEVDVGCGKGRFLLARAKARPGINFLGIDRLLVRIRRVDRRIRLENIRNVRLLRIEASYALEHLLPPLSVSVFYIFFPDPWPKRRHHKRRLFTESFMNSVYASLVPGGEIHLATDHLDYFQKILGVLRKDQRFVEVPPFQPADEERTDFELVFRGQNVEIGRCSFKERQVGSAI